MRHAIAYRALRANDHAELVALWLEAGRIEIRPSDTPEALAAFLARNPDCSQGAFDGDRLIGAVLAGHDGWRGYLYHMAVAPEYRGHGIGRHLVQDASAALTARGVPRVHCLVKIDNAEAQAFWAACGFDRRDELCDYTLTPATA